MASFLTYTTLFTLILIFLTPFSTLTHAKFSQQFLETTTPHHAENTHHLHFYFHDIVSGEHPTAITVAGQKTKFGSIAIIDDPLTEGVDPGSKVVGRAQGMYGMSSQDLASLLMVMNFVFTEGKYNGSSISVLGVNRFLENMREMPMVGGSGIFRFARGYVLAKTEKYNVKTGDARDDVFVDRSDSYVFCSTSSCFAGMVLHFHNLESSDVIFCKAYNRK